MVLGPDAQQVYIASPHGARLQTDDGTAVAIISESEAYLAFGSNNVTINSSGIAINGVLTINGTPFLMYKPTGVTAGSGLGTGLTP